MKLTLITSGIFLSLSLPTLADNELDSGPGVFTGKTGEFTLFKSDKKNIKQDKKNSEINEFEEFKSWKNHKKTNSASYQEFLLWLEYKDMVTP